MVREAVVDTPTPDRFRVAMKASLWAWALYWPGGGLILLLGGLDLIGIVVTVAGIVGFVVMLRSGALDADSSRSMKEFLLERPMYMLAVLAAFVFAAPLFGPIEDAGLRLFSLLFVGTIILSGVRLSQWLRDTDTPVRASGADQVFILLGIVGFAATLVFLDAWLSVFGEGVATPSTPATVALANWLNLLYPPLVLLAARPFRDRLHSPFARAKKTDEPEPDAPADAPAAKRPVNT